MPQLEILDTIEASKRDITWPDLYFTPGYGKAVEDSDGAKWSVAIWNNGQILYPFIHRPVPAELGADGAWDAVSPYGYSGTWIRPGTTDAEVAAFRDALRPAMAALGCVAEFQRMGDLVPGWEQLFRADPSLMNRHHNDTIAIPVTDTHEACWTAYEGRARTAVRKAVKKGYTWRTRTAKLEDMMPGGVFRRLYEETMTRVESAPYYFFSDTYYEALFESLGEQLRITEVLSADQHVSVVGLSVVFGPFLHSHLVGSEWQAGRDGGGNMLYDAYMQWGCADPQIHTVHLGGGMTKGDAMYKFKRSFGGNAVPFHVAWSVFDQERYEQLVAERAEQTQRTPRELVESGYFPAYRG